MAELLLADRGKLMDPAEKQRLIEEYLKEKYSPQEASAAALVFGYLLAAAGGLIGFAIGIALYISKSTDPEGNKYYSYTKTSRMAGLGMVITGVVTTLFALLLVSL